MPELTVRSAAAACLELADLPQLLSALLGGALLLGVLWIGTRRLRGAPSDKVPVGHTWQISTFPVCGRRDGQEPTKRKRKEKDAPDQPNGAARSASPEDASADSSRTQDSIRTQDSSRTQDSRAFRPKKKKVKTDDEERSTFLPKDHSSSMELSEEEDSGEWERKMSSKEKRQLRKERIKRKGSSRPDPTVSETPGLQRRKARPLVDSLNPQSTGSCRDSRPYELGNMGRHAVEWAPPAKLQDDIFSHVGTWNLKDVVTERVTFGTVPDISYNSFPQPSPSCRKWRMQMTSLNMEQAWLGLDPLDMDQASDWKPPREEWGNWQGDSMTLPHNGVQSPGAGRKQKHRLEVRAPPESKVTPDQQLTDESNTKKHRRKKRGVRKTT
ncbi:uncharacterized protein LOC125707983 isoform X2 [Brienomyrus brachyistius]|uniref:uncharacterized protein LOC125707983 isoform X2 n=1 Tax=Brienomyrus brachyistius TaxID=42636 RepID=UPI0020B37907|nr:uncharacterized protein LOC125707983 isoform X2 [Brienomyrus brachyistius]